MFDFFPRRACKLRPHYAEERLCGAWERNRGIHKNKIMAHGRI
jgi:hypothetical protein